MIELFSYSVIQESYKSLHLIGSTERSCYVYLKRYSKVILKNVSMPNYWGVQILMSHWICIGISGQYKFSKNLFSKQLSHLYVAGVWYEILKVQ